MSTFMLLYVLAGIFSLVFLMWNYSQDEPMFIRICMCISVLLLGAPVLLLNIWIIDKYR